MITEITSLHPSPALCSLLSYATYQPIDEVFKEYFLATNRQLFSCKTNDQLIGCIGIERTGYACIIKHIAVDPKVRGNGVGSRMITYILTKETIHQITAQTDQDAVNFYRKFGFSITSLGEQYPGVERFHCSYSLK